jgi:general secretion pathway protein N
MAVIRLMWPFGLLLLISTAAAAAGPIDEPLRPPREILGAPAPAAEGNGARGLSEASRAPDRKAKPHPGNPLWTVPLNTLSATRDRPLFSVSRRPPFVAPPMVAPPQKHEALAPPPPERPSLKLIGTIVGRKGSLAVLQGSEADAVSRLRVGEENNGWLIRGIGLRSVVVEKGAQSVQLDLPRPNGSPPQ